jgi:signal peptidase I
MANSSETPESPESAQSGAMGLYTVGGATLAILGGAMLLLHRFTGVDLPEWLYYCAVGALVLGIVEWALGRMTPEAARDWNKSLIFALGLAMLIRWPIAEPYRIPSGSMETTLHGDPAFGKGDRVFVNKWVYGVRYPFLNKRIWHGQDPQRWDIVVFQSVEPDAQHPTLVKRIVGMPGERIQIRSGHIYVNNEELPIPDFMPKDQYYTAGFGMTYGVRSEPEYSVVPEGHYLVLGDNSANSRDGRYFGWLPNENIVGRVASIWWPPPRWRDFTGFSHTFWWNGLLFMLTLYCFIRLFIGRSWPVLNAARDGVDHLFISFVVFGLRIPMTTVRVARWGKAERGDLVLYRPVGDAANEHDLLLGRVAGLAGDEVHVHEGKLLVGGVAVSASWLDRPIASLGGVEATSNGKVHVADGQLFILTDCPEDESALDSRVMGTVPAANLLGRAAGVWWPLKRAGAVK